MCCVRIGRGTRVRSPYRVSPYRPSVRHRKDVSKRSRRRRRRLAGRRVVLVRSMSMPPKRVRSPRDPTTGIACVRIFRFSKLVVHFFASVIATDRRSHNERKHARKCGNRVFFPRFYVILSVSRYVPFFGILLYACIRHGRMTRDYIRNRAIACDMSGPSVCFRKPRNPRRSNGRISPVRAFVQQCYAFATTVRYDAQSATRRVIINTNTHAYNNARARAHLYNNNNIGNKSLETVSRRTKGV